MSEFIFIINSLLHLLSTNRRRRSEWKYYCGLF